MREPKLVTVFGGGGFIGRYVCERLFESQVRVRVVTRQPRHANYIQPLGQVGQFGFVRAEASDRDGVRRAWGCRGPGHGAHCVRPQRERTAVKAYCLVV